MNAINVVSDKGIEFESTYKETIQMINNLKLINITGIDIDGIMNKAMQIKVNCESELQGKVSSTYMEQASIRAIAEQVYSKGISDLLSLQLDLRPYDVYFTAYYQSKSIRNSLKDNVLDNPEQVKAFAKAIITLLNSVNYSDTRFYDTEKGIVEELYALAYLLIKKEVVLFNDSTILAWVKSNPIAVNFINQAVQDDILLLSKDSKKKSKLDVLVAECLKNGFGSTFLDIDILKYIASFSNVDMKVVMSTLEKLYNEIEDLRKDKFNGENVVNSLTRSNKEIKKDIIINDFFKNIALVMASTAACVGIVVGSFAFSNRNSYIPLYMTYKDIYSSSENVQTPNAPEYMEKLEEGKDTVLIEYTPWEKYNYTNGGEGYTRDITTYDLSPVQVEDYEDYLDIDYKVLCEGTYNTDSTIKIDLDRLYDEAILEVVHYTQDMNDVTNGGKSYFWKPLILGIAIDMVTLLITYLLTFERDYEGNRTGYNFLIGRLKKTIIYYNEWKNNRHNYKENGIKLKKALEELKDICAKNEEVRKLFLDILARYESQLPNGTKKDKFLTLARKIKK